MILAAESLPEFLDLIRNSLLLQALAEVYRQGAGWWPWGGRRPPGRGGLLRLGGRGPGGVRPRPPQGLALLPRVEERGRFLALSRLVADNPDLVGLGLLENTALRLLRGLGEVWAGGVTLVDAGGAEYTGRGVRGLRVDVLSTGERFPLPSL